MSLVETIVVIYFLSSRLSAIVGLRCVHIHRILLRSLSKGRFQEFRLLFERYRFLLRLIILLLFRFLKLNSINLTPLLQLLLILLLNLLKVRRISTIRRLYPLYGKRSCKLLRLMFLHYPTLPIHISLMFPLIRWPGEMIQIGRLPQRT